MKKTILSLLAVCGSGTILLIMFICTGNIKRLQAADKYVMNGAVDDPHNIGGATFVSHTYQLGSIYTCKIVMEKDGKETVIAEHTDGSFVTNGEVLYYSKRGRLINKDFNQFENTIYSYNVESGKRTKIITGIDYTVRNCNGTFLYCGTDRGADGVDLYAVNLESKKKKYMIDVVGAVEVSGKKVVTGTNTGAIANLPIYSFNQDGSGKKKIADGGLITVRKGRIYYFICDEKTYDKYKVYQCTFTGKNKKPLTGWITGTELWKIFQEL